MNNFSKYCLIGSVFVLLLVVIILISNLEIKQRQAVSLCDNKKELIKIEKILDKKLNDIRFQINKNSAIKKHIQSIILKTDSSVGLELSYMYAEEIVEVSVRYKSVNPLLLTSVIYQESRFDKDIISHAGAQGLGQIMPETFNWICDKWNLVCYDSTVFDPIINIRMTAWYLEWLYRHPSICKKNEQLRLAYYNGGGRQAYRYSLYIKEQNNDSLSFAERNHLVRLSTETKKYVRDITKRTEEYTQQFNMES